MDQVPVVVGEVGERLFREGLAGHKLNFAQTASRERERFLTGFLEISGSQFYFGS
jgi:hypothetical protein